MNKTRSITSGPILSSLLSFALPVLLSLLLQALYGGVDLLIVGQFAGTADVSGVATGSMLMQTVTTTLAGLAMGVSILIGEHIGAGKTESAGHAIGNGILLFAGIAALLTAVLVPGAGMLVRLLHAPQEAFAETRTYVAICGAGVTFIIAYNVLGAVFRGIGDSKTPLLTVAIACAVNIAGDLLLVAVLHMGSAGAALATVLAQGVRVAASFAIIRRRTLPFAFGRRHLRLDARVIGKELRLGVPIALQDLLVGTSFLIIQSVVNTFGVVASAGVGVAERVCAFIMLPPSAFSQSVSTFVAQNMGASRPDRAKRSLACAIAVAFSAGAAMGLITFFRGDLLASAFSTDAQVIAAAHDYLRAYAIDCALTPFLFCFIGYYTGCERTLFVMLQGLIGAFLVRVPVVLLVSRLPGVTLFTIGLSTPASSLVQIAMCVTLFVLLERRNAKSSQRR